MGRFFPSARQVVNASAEHLAKWRRALRKEDQEAFDELLRHFRSHAGAAGYSTLESPFENLVLSVLVEQQKQLRRLRKKLGEEEITVSDCVQEILAEAK